VVGTYLLVVNWTECLDIFSPQVGLQYLVCVFPQGGLVLQVVDKYVLLPMSENSIRSGGINNGSVPLSLVGLVLPQSRGRFSS
jgi:hypothetical protein